MIQRSFALPTLTFAPKGGREENLVSHVEEIVSRYGENRVRVLSSTAAEEAPDRRHESVPLAQRRRDSAPIVTLKETPLPKPESDKSRSNI